MNRHVRTDLALELREDIEDRQAIEGVKIFTGFDEDSHIRETRIEVTNKRGEALLGKPVGTYITLESDRLRGSDEGIHEPFVDRLNSHLEKMLDGAENILVIGLGNRDVTPDALGPYVVDNLYITRHLLSEGIINNVKEISAICPGVMAQTGIESQVILKALIGEIHPDAVIAVDALAAREPDRLNSTIQICDTGICPGAGVGNNRTRLDEATLGVRVIAVGVPTVISVPAIINQAIEGMVNALTQNKNDFKLEFSDDEKYQLACELASPALASMFVTPKDIDEAVKRVSFTISEAINRLLE
jgi:spore protease